MSEMIERVSRAMYGPGWEMVPQQHQEVIRRRAREVIKAMREATEAMVGVGSDVVASGVDCHVHWQTIADDCHRAMIDAALEPQAGKVAI
jgi:hypothetical protein